MTPEPRDRSRISSGPPPWPPCPPCPPCPPKKRLKKSWNGLSSSPPPGPSSPGVPRRPRCGFLIVDSVLMLTTEGSIWRAIWENWLDNCTGEGTCSGVAWAEGFFSLPFTPPRSEEHTSDSSHLV